MLADIFSDHHGRGALQGRRRHSSHGVLAKKLGLRLHDARKYLCILFRVLVLGFEKMVEEPLELIILHYDKRRSGRLSIVLLMSARACPKLNTQIRKYAILESYNLTAHCHAQSLSH